MDSWTTQQSEKANLLWTCSSGGEADGKSSGFYIWPYLVERQIGGWILFLLSFKQSISQIVTSSSAVYFTFGCVNSVFLH